MNHVYIGCNTTSLLLIESVGLYNCQDRHGIAGADLIWYRNGGELALMLGGEHEVRYLCFIISPFSYRIPSLLPGISRYI